MLSRPGVSVAPEPALVAGRDVWLVHPWALGEPPADLPVDTLRIGWWPAEHHAAWPWTAARWSFVGTRMAALTDTGWYAHRDELGLALTGARSVQTVTNPHVAALLPGRVVQRPAPRLFAPVEIPCGSFSTWWSRCMHGVKRIADLPGLAGREV